ncbi:hypothetical protein CBL_05555 [Carabus blaptoides fortunei]
MKIYVEVGAITDANFHELKSLTRGHMYTKQYSNEPSYHYLTFSKGLIVESIHIYFYRRVYTVQCIKILKPIFPTDCFSDRVTKTKSYNPTLERTAKGERGDNSMKSFAEVKLNILFIIARGGVGTVAVEFSRAWGLSLQKLCKFETANVPSV